MPLRRRFRRKRVIPKRRTFRHRRRVVPRRRFNKSNLCHFKRTYVKVANIAVTGTAVVHALSFSLSDIPNSSEFTSLFQAYRLNKIVVRIQPKFNVGNSTGTIAAPQIVTAIDYNDDNAGFTRAQLLEYSTHRLHFGFRPMIRKFTPAIEGALLGATNAVVSGVQKFKQWVDTSAHDVKQFGFKVIFDPLAANTVTYNYDIYATTYFSCKQLQ